MVDPADVPEPEVPKHRRKWSRRRGFFGIRNGRLLALTVLSLAAGIAATYATAYLGIR